MKRARKTRPNRKQQDAPRAWRRPLLAWMAAFAVVAAVHVWLRLQTKAVGYELEEMHRLEQRLAEERAELEVDLARLTSPRVLDRMARERLGLAAPEAGQVVGIE